MKSPGWLIGSCIVICLVSVVGFLSWFILSFLDYEATSESEPPSVIDFSETGTVGYVIVKGRSIYFIEEKELLDEYGENIKWDELAKSNYMGHPADSVLVGKPVGAIRAELKTGDKVEVWYYQILESYPGKIKVEKIRKL